MVVKLETEAERKYNEIVSAFHHLTSVKKLKQSHALELIRQNYFLSESRIYSIISEEKRSLKPIHEPSGSYLLLTSNVEVTERSLNDGLYLEIKALGRSMLIKK